MESSKDLQELSAIYMRDVAEALNPKLQAIQDKAQADVKKRAAAAAAKKKSDAQSASDFQAHKKAVLAKGGRPVDALDSWQKKKLNKEENEIEEKVLTPGQKLAKMEKDDAAFGAPNVKTRKVSDQEPSQKARDRNGKWHEQVATLRGLVEKTKEKYKTVAAVIDYDRSKKGSEDADYDSEHGEDEKAKKERDYAAWEREKMKKDDPNWKHKKYHTGMHGEEMTGYIDAYQKIYEEPIQGEGAKGEVKKELKDLKKAAQTGKGKDVKKADEVAEVDEGLLVKVAKGVEGTAKAVGKGVKAFNKADEKVTKATMNRVVKPVAKAAGRAVVGGVKGAVKGALNKEGYQRNPEKGEEEERKRSKRVAGERTPMPPRGDKRREEFEKWYAANVR